MLPVLSLRMYEVNDLPIVKKDHVSKGYKKMSGKEIKLPLK